MIPCYFFYLKSKLCYTKTAEADVISALLLLLETTVSPQSTEFGAEQWNLVFFSQKLSSFSKYSANLCVYLAL